MTGKGTYFRVGLFVLAAMALIVLGVIAFGVGLTASRATFVVETYVQTSVQGVEAGSKIRNKGVEVGRVKRVTFIDNVYDVPEEWMIENGRWVLIRISLFKDTIPDDIEDEWEAAVSRGMRSRITSAGLAGGKYLEIDMLDPERFPTPEFPWKPKKPYIPSAASTAARIVETAENLSRRLDSAPIEEILEDVRDIVAGIKKQVDDADVAGLTGRANTVLDDVQVILESPDIPVILAEMRGASEQANQLVAQLGEYASGDEIQATLANLKDSTAGLPEITANLDDTIRRVDFLLLEQQGNIDRSLHDLRVMLADFRDLMATGKEYPSWAVFGNPPVPVDPEEQP